MKQTLHELIEKRFSVYVGGEFERTCNFLDLMQLFSGYSDFFSYSTKEKALYLKMSLAQKEFYVDANINVRIK